jgi:hypothetical protein
MVGFCDEVIQGRKYPLRCLPAILSRLGSSFSVCCCRPVRETEAEERFFWSPMAPQVRALAQSESKARFMARLGLDDRKDEHRQLYTMMKVGFIFSL